MNEQLPPLPEESAPRAIRDAYQTVVEREGGMYPTLRRRVDAALENQRRSKAYITEKQRLRPEDVSYLLRQADALHLLRVQLAKMVVERGGTFEGVVPALMQAISDADLIHQMDQGSIGVLPCASGEVPNEYVGWKGYAPNHVETRVHRTLREAILHALHPVESIEDVTELEPVEF